MLNFLEGIPAKVRMGVASLAIVVCLVFVAWPQFQSSWGAAIRHEGNVSTEYNNIDSWIESAECSRHYGTWATLCADGRFEPLLADDPGHSILLGVWAKLADRRLTHADVARLNLMMNSVGLLALVSALAALGRFWTALFMLAGGPYVYLEWFGTSAHWGHIGVMSAQFILPLSIFALATGRIRPRLGGVLIGIGLMLLALAALIRDPLGVIALFVTLGTLACMAVVVRRSGRPIASLIAIAVLAIVASQAAHISGAIRDARFSIDTRNAVASHGFAHNLYLGLGVVPNKWGITYDDAVALGAAKRAMPGIEDYSKDYFRVIRGLYLEKLLEDNSEAIRIYFEKLKIFLGGKILETAPPLWLFLIIVLLIQAAARRYGPASSEASDNRLMLNLVCLAFISVYVLQAVLAHPSRFFAMPIGACMLVMAGVAFENMVTLVVAMARWFAPPHKPSPLT